MPPRRRKQSNAMLYTLIIFVGLFIATTTIAVIYYVRAEEYRTRLNESQNQLEDYATSREQQTVGNTVGAKPGNQSYMGTMIDYLDQAVVDIEGGVPQPTSAEVKIANVKKDVNDVIQTVKPYINIEDPNSKGLIPIIRDLTTKLQNTINSKNETQKLLTDLQQRFKEIDEANAAKEQELLAEKDKLQKQVDEIMADYEQNKALLQQSTEEQVRTLAQRLDTAQTNIDSLNTELQQTQNQLTNSQEAMRIAREQVRNIMPPPDPNEMAYQPDGSVILVDDLAKSVHINIGSKDHVYRGLTFEVYERGGTVPENGKGKAAIEVFDISENYSAARITRSEQNRPVLKGDLIANLIWDSNMVNEFVITGEFDLNKDSKYDTDAIEKISSLITKWGGAVSDDVTVHTDYVILGDEPETPRRPTMEDIDIDPNAMEIYNAALAKLNRYNDIKRQAQSLWIPIMRYDKFLYFIGYQTQATQAGAF
jgi:hypothetical protein